MARNTLDIFFMGKNYTFPADIIEYIEILDITNDMSSKLIQTAKAKMNGDILSNDDLHNEMKKYAEVFIRRLCDKGIYSKAVDDYVFENEGYKEYERINQKALKAKCDFLADEITGFAQRREIAEANALSNITGSGYSVYTSSIATLAAASLAEYSTLKKQAKQADKQYRDALETIDREETAKREKRERAYIRNTYIPELENVLIFFVCGMMDKYISDLIEANLFDSETLNHVAIAESQKILGNISYAENKNDLLIKAFTICPFNVQIYINLVSMDIFEKDYVDTICLLKQRDNFINQIEEMYRDNPYIKKKLKENLNRKEKYIKILSMFSGTPEVEYKKEFAKEIYNNAIENYSNLNNDISANKLCLKIVEEYGDKIVNVNEDELRKLAQKQVKSIITNDDFITLINDCQYFDLIKTISPSDIECNDKNDIDTFYINKLFKIICDIIQDKKKELSKIADEKRIQYEKMKLELIERRKKQKKIAVIVIIILSIISIPSITYVTVFRFIIPNRTYNKAMNLYQNGKFDTAISELETIKSYKDSENKIIEIQKEKKYQSALDMMNNNDFEEAINIFSELEDYKESENNNKKCQYELGNKYFENSDFKTASDIFLDLNGYLDSDNSSARIRI